MAMRVLMFGWELPPHNSGGLGTACQGLLRALADEGVHVTFVLPRPVAVDFTGGRVMYADIENISFEFVDVHLTPYIVSTKDGVFGHGSSLVDEVVRYAKAAKAIARREQFDVIHAHDWLSFGAGIAAKEVSGKPLIAHVHATQFDHNGGNEGDRVLHEMEREGLEKADQIIAVSDFTKKIITRRYQIDPNRVHVVHNGVSPEASVDSSTLDLSGLKKHGGKIVLFLGRITLMKGPDYFIQAAQKVLRYEPNTYFILAGKGDMEQRMIKYATQLGISDRVLFAGFVRGDEKRALYQAADLYVLPSVSEPFGITPLEAIDAGTPVLISRQSGVSEVVRNALLVDFWDTDDMAEKIVSVLRHSSLGSTLLGNAAHEIIGVNWRKAAKKVQQIYRSIISLFKRKRGGS
ncbi:MAG: glycosyltransferase family 4 protein [bacterium]|nr:glycosyltransferase family 4 protein [bacterium]